MLNTKAMPAPDRFVREAYHGTIWGMKLIQPIFQDPYKRKSQNVRNGRGVLEYPLVSTVVSCQVCLTADVYFVSRHFILMTTLAIFILSHHTCSDDEASTSYILKIKLAESSDMELNSNRSTANMAKVILFEILTI